MAILLGGALGTLAAMGIIRALMLYLLKKIGRPDSWKTANFATAVVRSLLFLSCGAVNTFCCNWL